MRYQNMDLSDELMIVDREGNKTPFKMTRIECSPYTFPEVTGHLIGSVSKKKNGIKDVIFNNPATVVIWEDGTKTVVKCQEGDKYSEELGLAMCIAKKFFGNKGNFNEVFKKWLPKKPVEPREDMIHALEYYCQSHGCDECELQNECDELDFDEMSDKQLAEQYYKVFN